MNDQQKCWWEQAKSDYAVLVMLRQQKAAPCHQLHYLQMITEKLAKAFLWQSKHPPKKSHAGFQLFMKLLLQRQPSQRQWLAELFAFKRFEDFRNWTRIALPLVYELQKLAPALAGDGPNPEYPWPHDAPQYVPATFDFEISRELDTGRGRQLIKVIKTAVEKFPDYA